MCEFRGSPVWDNGPRLCVRIVSVKYLTELAQNDQYDDQQIARHRRQHGQRVVVNRRLLISPFSQSGTLPIQG